MKSQSAHKKFRILFTNQHFSLRCESIFKISAHADGGSSLLGLCTLDPLLSPPLTPAHRSARGEGEGKEIFSPFQVILSNFRLKKSKKNKSTSRSQEGSLILFSHPKSYFFGNLKPHAKFQNHTITPSGRKVSKAEERKKEEREKAGAELCQAQAKLP